MNFFKRHWPIVVGVGLPLLLIFGIFVSIYLPSRNAKPTQDFVFFQDNQPYADNFYYQVENGKVVKKQVETQTNGFYGGSTQHPKIYYYNVTESKSKELSFDEVQKYTLNTNTDSKDGFTVGTASGNGGIVYEMFGGYSNYNARYLIKGSVAKPVNLPNTDGAYYHDFQFAGWVE